MQPRDTRTSSTPVSQSPESLKPQKALNEEISPTCTPRADRPGTSPAHTPPLGAALLPARGRLSSAYIPNGLPFSGSYVLEL